MHTRMCAFVHLRVPLFVGLLLLLFLFGRVFACFFMDDYDALFEEDDDASDNADGSSTLFSMLKPMTATQGEDDDILLRAPPHDEQAQGV